MGARDRQRREDYQNAVEYLCANLAALDAKVADPAWRPTIKEVACAEPLTDPWYAAVRRLHEMAEAAGVPCGLGLTTPMGLHSWPGDKAVSRVRGWVCPTGACTRVELANDAVMNSKPDTECHVIGSSMRVVEG